MRKIMLLGRMVNSVVIQMKTTPILEALNKICALLEQARSLGMVALSLDDVLCALFCTNLPDRTMSQLHDQQTLAATLKEATGDKASVSGDDIEVVPGVPSLNIHSDLKKLGTKLQDLATTSKQQKDLSRNAGESSTAERKANEKLEKNILAIVKTTVNKTYSAAPKGKLHQ